MNDNVKKRILMGGIVLVLAVALGIGVYGGSKMSKIHRTDLDEGNLEVSKEMEEELGDEYLNVAVFGVNAKSKDSDQTDSDAVYIASLNTYTDEVKLVSVYGNTMMEHEGTTIRLRDAYGEGGPEEAIAVLNANLDLNIKNYVSVDFRAMVDVINILGGVDINVTEEEIPHINGYAQDIAGVIGEKAKEVTKPGRQMLDGMQAVGYCRIRVTDGGDVKRGQRQQAVIAQMLERMQEADFAQMDKIMDQVFPEVETNFETSELLEYGQDASGYTVENLPAFPREIEAQKREELKEGQQFADFEEVVQAVDFKGEVETLHKELFPDVSDSHIRLL